MKKLSMLLTAILACAAVTATAQDEQKAPEGYKFTDTKTVQTVPITNQYRSGTCWCFSTISFLEEEILRAGGPQVKLSEMWVVRNIYFEKAVKYVRLHGSLNFAVGGAAHDVTHAIEQYGIVPQEVYKGLNYGTELPEFGEIDEVLKAYVDAILKNKNGKLTPAWQDGLNAILDAYFGPRPETFTYEGKEYTPKSFAESLPIKMSDYIEFGSFTHHPFYKPFVIEVPDNWDHELLYNLPLDDMMAVIDNALNNGYTVCWDGDVSEQGYVFMPTGVAVLPADPRTDMQTIAASSSIIEEVEYVDQAMRQAGFESFTTTDDHLEHITGIATDPAGTRYYITKNSWGERGPFGGYHYMSEKYVRAKTVSILVHKDAIPSDIKAKMGL